MEVRTARGEGRNAEGEVRMAKDERLQAWCERCMNG